jgi:prolyl 4-hydroxylase
MTRHPKSLHGGSPVWGGQKWACNLWFRQHAYQSKPTRQVKPRNSRATPKKRR